jgi:hypothetical protein
MVENIHIKQGDDIDTSRITSLTTDGFIKTSGGDGTLSVDTTAYVTTSEILTNYLTTSEISTTYVPYSGATTNVSLGSYTLSAKNVKGGESSIGKEYVEIKNVNDKTYVVFKGSLGEQYFEWDTEAMNFVGEVGIPSSTKFNFKDTLVDIQDKLQLSYLTSNGFLKTGSSNGTLSVDTTTYLDTTTAGSTYVPYSGATSNVNLGSNNLTVNTNVLFVGATNNRVGIGTTAPTVKLHILDSGSVFTYEDVSLGVQNNANATDNCRICVVGGTTGHARIDFGDSEDQDAGAIFYSNANNSMNFRTNGASNRLVLDNAGNVGIGTTSPSSKLDVRGNIYAKERANYGSVRVLGKADYSVKGSLEYASSFGTFLSLDKEDGTETVRIRSYGDSYLNGGNVGINDLAPAEKLDVTGNINLTGVLKVDDVQVLKEQQAHIADAKTNYTAGDLDSEAEIITAMNATNAKINAILAMLEAHGLVATA